LVSLLKFYKGQQGLLELLVMLAQLEQLGLLEIQGLKVLLELGPQDYKALAAQQEAQ
jgi:hypothetical protein